MSNGQESIEKLLKNQIEIVRDRVRQRKEQLRDEEDLLKRLSSALTVLEGKTSRRKNETTSCSHDDVSRAMEAILEDGKELEIDELRTLVKSQLSQSHSSLNGFTKVFKEILKGDSVVEVSPGVVKKNVPVHAKRNQAQPV